MDFPRPAVDLEKELTCSICTEVLYQPLTLLDCLHTFCGSCLKDWFSWQAAAAESSPNPPAAGVTTATCPSCRAPVRDTRHNATVATLLDMFLSANPEKVRSEADKEEMLEKYKPGDNVLPRVRTAAKSSEERRLDEVERQMLQQAREMSLRDAGVDSSAHSQHPRQRRDRRTRHRDSSDRSDRESSRDSRHRDARDRARRATREEERRHGTEPGGMLQAGDSSDERQHRRSGSQQRSRDSSRIRRRAIEHQASIRSLISSSDVDSREMEREIEDFARHIQEEGLLDGLDLDNIDLSRDDELSRRITEAYRRRQNQRSRHDASERNNTSSHSHRSEVGSSIARPRATESSRPSSRRRSSSVQPRNSSSTSLLDDRSRPPITSTHLEVRAGPERRRRRTSSGARSVTEPTRPSTAEIRPSARSQTDLTLRSHTSDLASHRAAFAESRSTSMPTKSSGSQPPGGSGMSFGERASAVQNTTPAAVEPPTEASNGGRTRRRPTDLVVPQNPLPSIGIPSSPGHRRTRSQYYPEPSITCSRCSRPHIEYMLHYNCSKCSGGNWNICLDCYRAGRGCLHWFGFGYSAFTKWEKARANGNEQLEPPHLLTANRYAALGYAPGGADGRRTLTTDDPMKRLQSGMFCVRCFAWANECYWRCDVCNEGDWGFCNNCVNQGRGCTHPLLPLTYVSPHPSSSTPPASPRLPNPPVSASILTGPNAISIGNFKPLTFTNTCDICRLSIAPNQNRHHCHSCTSTVVPDAQPGDYNICTSCYAKLVSDHHISKENGRSGWRRCLNGHRMVVICFQDGSGGQRRHIVQDLVGGWDLHMIPHEPPKEDERNVNLQKWWWYTPDRSKLERLVTREVAASAPVGAPWTDRFPPDGGSGMKTIARWAWYPQVGSEDELLFPKGAEVTEVEDVNGDWFFGCYMGGKGLFPAPYVRVIQS